MTGLPREVGFCSRCGILREDEVGGMDVARLKIAKDQAQLVKLQLSSMYGRFCGDDPKIPLGGVSERPEGVSDVGEAQPPLRGRA